MEQDRHILFLKNAFLVNLTLMSLVMLDFVYMESRFVTLLVVAYALFVVVLSIAWAILTRRVHERKKAAEERHVDVTTPQRV